MDKIVFERYKVLPQKLLAFGFETRHDGYFKTAPLMDGQFIMETFVRRDGSIETRLLDTASEEEYVLHLVKDCGGAFVGEVRKAYEEALAEIRNTCFETNCFKGKQTAAVIDYIRTAYGAEPEYLWESTPENAVFRRADNKKWFAAILSVKRNRLSLTGEEIEEIIDFRAYPAEIPALIAQKRYLGGYHMNKKHWLTALLDGSVPLDELFARIDESYRLAKR